MRRNIPLPSTVGHYRTQSRGREGKDTVECEITLTKLCSKGMWHDGVQAVCSRCGQQTESFGTGPKSVRRCLAIMHDKCLRREDNFYVVEPINESEPKAT